jgi:hypothetical protein
MAKIEETRTFLGKSPDQLYTAFEPAYLKAGFNTWKKRPVGWLALAKRQEADSDVQSTLSARPGNPSAATLVITSEKQTQEQLQAWAVEIWKSLDETALA